MAASMLSLLLPGVAAVPLSSHAPALSTDEPQSAAPVLAHSTSHASASLMSMTPVRMLAQYSTMLQSSQSWVGMPNYAQAILMVLAVVGIFAGLWLCTYCCCLMWCDMGLKHQARRSRKIPKNKTKR